MSINDAEKDEVAAFEEFIGSHGDVGSSQSNPFIMYSSKWNIEDVEIVGAKNVYQLFKREMANASTKFYEVKRNGDGTLQGGNDKTVKFVYPHALVFQNS